MVRRASLPLAVLLLSTSGCAPKNRNAAEAPGSAPTTSPEKPGSAPATGEAQGVVLGNEPERGGGAPDEPPPAARPGAGSKPLLRAVVASGPPLPELRVKTFGLHVGGGRNDADEKAAYLKVLERGFPRFLDCYRLMDAPGREGTFGVDLQIAVQGGRARVGQPRTALPGNEFSRCMVRGFEALKFAPQERPTVISYSLKFNLGQN